ncbi:MAG: TIM barrel protein, partial [Lentisphaeria bacterium]
MMPEMKLVHFVEWKKIADQDIDKVLSQLVQWGVQALVAHPCWGLREQELPGYLARVNSKISAAGLSLAACHAFWGAGYDLGNLREEQKEQVLQQHCDFLLFLGGMGVRTYTLHSGFSKGMQISESVWKNLASNVQALLPAAADAGIILALENGQ